MKLKILSKALIPVSALAISSPLVLTSCNKKVDWNDNSYINFLYERTFCLKATSSSGSIISGTMWILADATPNTNNDFTYWCATNNHVMKEIQSHQAVSGLAVAQNSSPSGFYEKGESFCEIGWSACKDLNQKLTFDGSDTNGIDMSIMKMNLSAVTELDSYGNAKYPIMKSNLESVNKYRNEHGCTTPIAKTVSSNNNFANYKVATAGYPVLQNQDKYKWESHTLSAGELEYTLNRSHYDPLAMDVNDTSPNYFCKNNKRTTPSTAKEPGWMDAGASGSMIITKNNNRWEVIGIYWGGFSNDANTEFYPCFSIFNSDRKNFVKDYIK